MSDDGVQQVLALAAELRKAGTALVDAAHEQRAAEKIGAAEYGQVWTNYVAMMQKATDLTNAAAHGLAAGAAVALAPVEAATRDLNRRLERLKESEQLLQISMKLVIVVAAVAVAVIDPTHASAGAAVAAIIDAAETIGAQAAHEGA